jgi:hypothetical protein
MRSGHQPVDDASEPEEATMKHTFTTATITVTLAACVAGLALTACGDDEPTETAQQYLERVQEECPGGDPGFDPFLSEHPEPNAQDWAGFLPQPLAMLSTMTECIAASDPPDALQDEVDAVTAASQVVVDDFEEALAAAEAGDLEATNTALTRMHDVDQPAMQVALDSVLAAAAG